MEAPPMFNSVEDECRYWKERAKLYHKEWTDVKQEYDEYVEQSRQMEAEMDATLDQKQALIKDLKSKISSLEKENDSLKLKLDSHGTEYTNIEKQLENVKQERDSMKEYLRQLEQKNDDLERAHRILNESIVDFERMLDKAYEKNALLEMEVDEKEVLQEKLQRLMDETRDLKQELNVKARYPSTNGTTESDSLNIVPQSPTITNGIGGISNGDILLHNEMNSSTTAAVNNYNGISGTANINDYNHQQSLKRKPYPDPESLLNGNAMTASSRTTALNIVADMLRKLNLDKALLCPTCSRFRCVCARPTTDSAAPTSPNTTSAPISFELSPMRELSAATTPITSSQYNPSDEVSTSGSSSTLSSSRSFSNLNFGTNIFKRFAERMSNSNVLRPSTTTTTTTTQQHPTVTNVGIGGANECGVGGFGVVGNDNSVGGRGGGGGDRDEIRQSDGNETENLSGAWTNCAATPMTTTTTTTTIAAAAAIANAITNDNNRNNNNSNSKFRLCHHSNVNSLIKRFSSSNNHHHHYQTIKSYNNSNNNKLNNWSSTNTIASGTIISLTAGVATRRIIYL